MFHNFYLEMLEKIESPDFILSILKMHGGSLYGHRATFSSRKNRTFACLKSESILWDHRSVHHKAVIKNSRSYTHLM